MVRIYIEATDETIEALLNVPKGTVQEAKKGIKIPDDYLPDEPDHEYREYSYIHDNLPDIHRVRNFFIYGFGKPTESNSTLIRGYAGSTDDPNLIREILIRQDVIAPSEKLPIGIKRLRWN